MSEVLRFMAPGPWITRDLKEAVLASEYDAVVKAVDDLGVAIADAGYEWTPAMREAYERATRKA